MASANGSVAGTPASVGAPLAQPLPVGVVRSSPYPGAALPGAAEAAPMPNPSLGAPAPWGPGTGGGDVAPNINPSITGGAPSPWGVSGTGDAPPPGGGGTGTFGPAGKPSPADQAASDLANNYSAWFMRRY